MAYHLCALGAMADVACVLRFTPCMRIGVEHAHVIGKVCEMGRPCVTGEALLRCGAALAMRAIRPWRQDARGRRADAPRATCRRVH